MTCKEKTGIRDLTFSKWIRENLPNSSTGFMVTDVDFIIYNYKSKKIIIVEIKTRNSEIKQWQRIFYKNLNRWIKNGIDNNWEYLGVHLIKFDNTNFENGNCYLDNKIIDDKSLIKFLSLKE